MKFHSRRSILRTLALGSLSFSANLLHFIGASTKAVAAASVTDSTNSVLAKKHLQTKLLDEFDFGQVQLGGLAKKQFDQTISVIMQLNEDSIMKPFRMRAEMDAPGQDLGGWYDAWDGTDVFHEIERGFAPGHCFGQWLSALARAYAITGSQPMKEKMQRLIKAFATIPAEKFHKGLRYPGYTYDKIVCALIDAHKWAAQSNAFAILDKTTDAVIPLLPDRTLSAEEMRARPHLDESYCWDELYTISENLFIAYERGAGERYKKLGAQYLKDDTFFDPLAEGRNVLPGKHAYSYANALSSGIQAYLVLGSEKHLRAAKNAFDMIRSTQSFATGGWGPNESFVEPGKGYLAKSLMDSHKGFETPCGGYAHMKLTRYLLRISKDSRYGDSLEQIIYNTVLGAKPLLPDGRGFYYSDYNFYGEKYYRYAWTCCTGSLPQVVADYHLCAYFKDDEGIFVNLYIPSTVKHQIADNEITLSQATSYPLDGTVTITVSSKKPVEMKLRLRIPQWAGPDATLTINGKKKQRSIQAGKFAELERIWNDGDTIEISLPMPLRLLPVAPENPDIVALMYGPLALFAITDEPPTLSKREMLSAQKTGDDLWVVETKKGKLSFRPFTSIDKEKYSLYLKTSS